MSFLVVYYRLLLITFLARELSHSCRKVGRLLEGLLGQAS